MPGLQNLVQVSERVRRASGRIEKIEQIVALLRSTDPREIEITVAFLSGRLRQGRIGIGYAAIAAARPSAAPEPTLELPEVDATFERIAAAKGAGSSGEKGRLLHALLARATADEQAFLTRLLFGELRQGALEGIMLEAVARAAGVPVETFRRAVMAEGNVATAAKIALLEGETGLLRVAVRLFRPIRPMLAQSAGDAGEAIDRLGEAALEYKVDGARVQIHKQGDDVRVFSRRLREVTPAVPEVVDAVRTLPAREMILDGEAIALRPDRTPHPFQATMRRFGRTANVAELRDELPLSLFLFDLLYRDGEVLIDLPYEQRTSELERQAGRLFVPRIVTATAEQAEQFLEQSLDAGHEGIMAKSLAAPYAAGNRGSAWLKVKRAETLDLVVIAAEWGHGRRQGWLSNLHLAARNPADGTYVMLGKTFKGMTDKMLEWQTQKLREFEIGHDDYTIYVRPELVVEVAFGDVQASPRYPGGLALRFARIRRYRLDKTAEQADTIERVRQIHERSLGLAK